MKITIIDVSANVIVSFITIIISKSGINSNSSDTFILPKQSGHRARGLSRTLALII